jgi:RNA polymerase sigma-70 factor (ECF subfamily)
MQADEPDESENWLLAAKAALGNETAYEALISKYQVPVHRFVFRSVDDEETARDLTQEVFVKAWFGLRKASRHGRFTTWLFQIAVNVCRDFAKSKAARQTRMTFSLAADAKAERPQEKDFPHPDSPPDAQAEQAELTRFIDAQISELPDELRHSFLLGALEGESHKKVAEILGLSPKAVEVRIYRARRLLAQRLAESGLLDSS